MPDVLSRRISFLAALAGIAALTALSFAPVASAKTCAEQVIDDWYGNGRVDQIFPKHCYLEAIRSLPVDVKDYSNAEEDIRRALAFAGQGKPDPGPAGGPAPTGTGEDPSGTTPVTPTTPGDTAPGDQTNAAGEVDTSGPSSLPIPLLVLGGLALLLLAAGGAGYVSRRAQARRNGGPPDPA